MTTTVQVTSPDPEGLQAAVVARAEAIQQSGGRIVSVRLTSPTTVEIEYASGA